MKDDFYIGYLDGKPIASKRKIRGLIILLVLAAIIIPVWLILNQSKGEKTVYEFGSKSEVSGTVTLAPCPILHTAEESVLLVGFGKHGFNAKDIKNGSNISVEGTWIRGKGRALLEVVDGSWIKNSDGTAPTLETKGNVELAGRIIDPKCYFGAMNPGFGKTHRACAIRCISGGVPPVLECNTAQGMAYVILAGKDEQPINEQLLEWVDLPIQIKGVWKSIGYWDILEVDPNDIIKL